MDSAEHEKLFADRLAANTPRPAAVALAAAFKPSLVAYGEASVLAAAVLTPPQASDLPAELLAQVGAASAQLAHFAELRAAATLDVAAAVGPVFIATEGTSAEGKPGAADEQPGAAALAASEFNSGAAYVAARQRGQGDVADYLPIEACRDLLGVYREWGKANGFKARDLLMPLRIAVTGAEHGPELHFVLAALPGSETVARLQAALRAAGGSV
ncbi:MAG: hypothetical protein ACLQUT_08700 [Thermoleophilia bacterium]